MRRLTEAQCKKVIELRAGICEIPTCYETENLRVHHIKRFKQGGTNDLNNLMVLCEKHHKQIHFKEGPKK